MFSLEATALNSQQTSHMTEYRHRWSKAGKKRAFYYKWKPGEMGTVRSARKEIVGQDQAIVKS